MTLENHGYSYQGPDQPVIGETLSFVHDFCGENQGLEGLMREYVFQTRFNYIQENLRDEAEDRLDTLRIKITLSLIDGDRKAYTSENKEYVAKDRFRNYAIAGEETGNLEIDELLTYVWSFTEMGDKAINDKVAELAQIWEEKHPGQSFLPEANKTQRD